MMTIRSGREAWELLERSAAAPGTDERLSATVGEILSAVRQRGDQAIREIAETLGDVVPDAFKLSREEVESAVARVPGMTRNIIEEAAGHIRRFAEAAMESVQPVSLDYGDWTAGIEYRPVESAACYVPGGRFPLPSTALMTALTAQVAGVKTICIASPGMRDEIVFAGRTAGVIDFYNMGGAQAVAALAWGTGSITAVDMIVGPGNAYVTEAKRQLQGTVGIDMLAGPSEVAIIADGKANAKWVTLDMLAQAEHDPDARAWLLTDSEKLGRCVVSELERRSQIGDVSFSGLQVLVLKNLDECVTASNRLSPEHLQLSVETPESLKTKLRHYGALFMGHFAAVTFGDYMAGPNHTLPTGGTARFAGGLTPLTFLRPQSWMSFTKRTESLVRSTAAFAKIEGLRAHAAAALARCGGRDTTTTVEDD